MRACRILATARNTQLDGWRAFAVLGVMWHHWAPVSWRGIFPFEIGLFFFLTLTGFLIGRILLRDKETGERGDVPWRAQAYQNFLKRRMFRILVPCYAAMVFAICVGARDISHHPVAYFAHFSNFHMALLPGWPSGTAHYWTLAIQMQFYLLFPLLIFCVPKRALPTVLMVFSLVAPVSRWALETYFPEIYHLQAITTSAFDYFGIGALLAVAMERGTPAGDWKWRWVSLVAGGCYLVCRGYEEFSTPLAGVKYFQQTFVSIAFAGLISSTLAGFRGGLGKLLNHPAVQHVGRISYGLYLFHTPVPLLLGYVMPFLWHPVFDGPLLMIRLLAFFLTSWGLAWLCWRYLEKGVSRPAV